MATVGKRGGSGGGGGEGKSQQNNALGEGRHVDSFGEKGRVGVVIGGRGYVQREDRLDITSGYDKPAVEMRVKGHGERGEKSEFEDGREEGGKLR